MGHLRDIWDKLENHDGSIYLKVARLLARLGKWDSNKISDIYRIKL